VEHEVGHAKENPKLIPLCQLGQKNGGKSQSAEEVAHKAAWAAVKQKYKKQGGEWVSKE
jgi:hypothetical protein